MSIIQIHKGKMKMKMKILAGLLLSIVILIGGAYIFIQTKSDVILAKISSMVEEATGAPLHIESLPSIGIIPSPSISIGKASWGTEDFSITFDEAKVKFSFFALLAGNISLPEVQIDNLKLIYADNAIVKTVKPKTTNQEPIKVEQQIADTLTELFNVVPKNIIINNAHIEYSDKNQHIVLKNLNTRIQNFGMNQNAKVNLDSQIEYTKTAENTTKSYAIDFDTDFNFLFMGDNLNFELTKLIISPKNGFSFSKEITTSGSTDVFLSPFYLRSLSAQIDSPFITAKINQNGDINRNEGMLSIDAKLFPVAIVEAFAPHKKFQNAKELQEASFHASLSFKNKIIKLQNLVAQLGGSELKSILTYDIGQNKLWGDISLANLQLTNLTLQDVPNKNIKAGNNKTNAENDSINTNSKKKSAAISLPKPLDKTDFDVSIRAANLRYNKIIIETLDTKLQGKNSLLSMNPIKIQSMKSSILATLNMNLTAKQSVSLSIDSPFIDLGTWAKALLDTNIIRGEASIKSTLSFPINNPISNINAKGDVKLSSLHIQTKLAPALVKILQSYKVKTEDFQFAAGHIPFKISKSIAHLTNAYLSSQALKITTSGYINLKNNGLDLEAQIDIVQKLSIPISITGSLQQPKVKINPASTKKVIGDLLKRTIKKESGKRIINKLDKLFGR